MTEKNKVRTLLLAAFWICFLPAFGGNRHAGLVEGIEELIVPLPLHPAALEKNAFIILHSIDFPENNYPEIYARIFRNNYQKFLTALENNEDISAIRITYLKDHLPPNAQLLSSKIISSYVPQQTGELLPEEYFPCIHYRHPDCLKESEEKKVLIQEILADKKILLNRYQNLLKQANHYTYIDYPNHNYRNLVASPMLRTLRHLNLTAAITALIEGQYETGRALLEYETQMRDLLLNDISTPTLIDFMHEVVERTQTIDQVLDALLTRGYFDHDLNNPQVAALFTPYINKAQHVLLRILETKFTRFTPSPISLADLKAVHQPSFVLNIEEEYHALSWLTQFHVIEPIGKRFETLKNLDDAPKTAIERERNLRLQQFKDSSQNKPITMDLFLEANDKINAALAKKYPNYYEKYFQKREISYQELVNYFHYTYGTVNYLNDYHDALAIILHRLENTPYHSIFDDITDEVLKNFGQDLINSTYQKRIAEQSSYHHLVILKYQIMRAGIPDEKIDSFLHTSGSIARHAVTGERFLWTPEDRTLSVPITARKYLPDQIKRNYDEGERFFKVFIPGSKNMHAN